MKIQPAPINSFEQGCPLRLPLAVRQRRIRMLPGKYSSDAGPTIEKHSPEFLALNSLLASPSPYFIAAAGIEPVGLLVHGDEGKLPRTKELLVEH